MRYGDSRMCLGGGRVGGCGKRIRFWRGSHEGMLGCGLLLSDAGKRGGGRELGGLRGRLYLLLFWIEMGRGFERGLRELGNRLKCASWGLLLRAC